MTQTIIFVSDLHCNSTVAICPPEVSLDDGDIHEASKAQLWLWDNWLRVVDRVSKIDNHKTLVVNGDAVELDAKKYTFQLISENPADIVEIGYQTMKPLVAECDELIMIKGTPVHGGNSGWAEEMLAGKFEDKIIREPETNKKTHWKVRMTTEGVRFDIAHHGRMGQLPHTQHGYTMRLAVQLGYIYAKEGEQLPHIAVRSHQHRWSDSFDNEPIRVIFTPAWQLATGFIHRISESSLADIGALLVHVDGDKYEVEKIPFTPEKRKWITSNSKEQQSQKKKSSESLKKTSLINRLFQRGQ